MDKSVNPKVYPDCRRPGRPGRPAKPKIFPIPDGKTKPLPQGLHKIPPQSQAQAIIMSDDGKRDKCAAVVNAFADTLLMEPVRSNAELKDRGEDYFRFIANRRLYPTIESLALYLGTDWKTLRDWETGKYHPFTDGIIPTSDIVRRLKSIVEAVDGDLSADGTTNIVGWIFRRKALSGWQDVQKVEISAEQPEEVQHLSPEQIAKLLPQDDEYDLK